MSYKIEKTDEQWQTLLRDKGAESGQFTGFTKSNNTWYVLSTTTHAALVSATIHLGSNFHTWIFSAYIQCTNSFWTVHFMTSKCHDINTVFVYIYGYFTYRLNCI